MNKRTVLIIEDNELNYEILRVILEEDYNLLNAYDGRQGLQMLRDHVAEIDVVLLDIQMPVMNGYEVLEEVSHDNKLHHIPIIVTTGSESMDEEERCLKMHATDFIRKPYNPHVVRLRIESLIRLREFAATLGDVELDKQTGVYTRGAFLHYAQEMINNNPEEDYTLLMTDVRGFKRLYDQYGEQTFDILRKEITIFRMNYPEHIIIGTYNTDELLLLHPTMMRYMSDEEKERWYEELMVRMSKVLNITLKAGVCEHIDTNEDLATHVKYVHAALAEVKKSYNRHSKFVGKELLDKLQRNARIEELMEVALAKGQMEVFYQPKHDAKTEALVGAEALLRWNSPELGMVSPMVFIPIFEKNGFVSEADAFVWRETCKNQRKWMKKKLKVVPISVNASRQDFALEDLNKRIIAPMTDNKVPGELMHIEITESLFANLSEVGLENLQSFRDRGIQVELDDFGTGYSSLNSLSELPIDIVKFDISFVRKLNDPRKQKVMKGSVALIKDLDLRSVAEGVEDAETRQLVADMGIDLIQGYYYAKPMPVAEFEKYLAKYS